MEKKFNHICVAQHSLGDMSNRFDHLVDKSEVKNESDDDRVKIPGQNYMVFSFASPEASQKCNMMAVKIRGVFDTEVDAFAQAKKIQLLDKNFDVWVMDMWKWCPFPPSAEDGSAHMHYEQQSQKLADLMSHINNEKSGKNTEFIERLQETVE